MYLKIFLIFNVMVIGFLHGSDGQFICETDGLTGQRAFRTTPGSTTADFCSGEIGLRSCYGDPGSSYVQCYCTDVNNASPPGTDCWTAGEKLTNENGECNSDVPLYTAVAIFNSNGAFSETVVVGAFMGCAGPNATKIFFQNCDHPLEIVPIPRTLASFNQLYVVAALPVGNTKLTSAVDCAPVPKDAMGCNLDTGVQVCKT